MFIVIHPYFKHFLYLFIQMVEKPMNLTVVEGMDAYFRNEDKQNKKSIQIFFSGNRDNFKAIFNDLGILV